MGIHFNGIKKTFFLFFPKKVLSLRVHQIRCCIAALLILVDIAVASFVPYYSKLIINSLSLNILGTVWTFVILLGFFWTLGKIVNHIQEIIFFPVINATIRELTFKVVKHVHHISLPNYQKLSIPEIINCVRRISHSARSFIKIVFLMIVPTFFKLMIATLVAIKVGLFGLFLLPTLFLSLLILYKGTEWYVTAREDAWQISDKVTMRISDSILNTKIIRPMQTFEMNTVGQLLTFEANLWQKANTRIHLIHILIGILLGVALTSILFCASLAIQHQTLTVGDFVLLQGQLIAAFLPLKSFSTEFRQLAESLVDIKKIIQIFEIPLQSDLTIPIVLPKNAKLGLTFKKVSFSHDNNIVFENLSLQISAGKKIGITGESGCGKSALINLMASLYRPSKGNIYIEGKDVNLIPRDQLQKYIHCIPQDFRLFNLSLRDNITYGIQSVPEANLIHVMEQLDLLNIVQQMPEGFDTLVGEMGIKLSGGEKQKIALARALLLNPEILLLDETTNSLNIESERRILQVLFSSIPTIVLVSHRAATLQGFDEVYKIQQGKLQKVDVAREILYFSNSIC